MIVVLTNIPTPYRTSFFDVFYEECKKRNIGFKVLYCAKTESNRHWPFEPEEMKHPFEVLDGATLKTKGIEFHLNFSVVKKLKALKPNYLICAGSWNMPTNLLALATVRYLQTKTIFWSEGHLDAVRYKKGFISKIRRFVLSKFDSFAVPNNKSKKWIELELEKAIEYFTLPNTVDEEFFKPTDNLNVSEMKSELAIPSNKKVFLQVSQLESRKGVIELVNSFLSIPESKRKDWLLVICGTGSLFDRLKALELQSNGSVFIAGHVDKYTIRKYLWLAEWFILNTNRDPNPLTPIEASFTGTPLILSNKAGNFEELCLATECIEINNVADVEDALLSAINMDPAKYEELKVKVSDNAIDNFSRREVVCNLLAEIN